MILDKNNKKIKIGDKIKNLDNNKTFNFSKEMEIVLHHAELLPHNFDKTWKYNHLVKLS